MDWRELHLTRRSRAFNFTHRWLKVAAIVIGFPVTIVCLMTMVGRFTGSFDVRVIASIAIALAVPGLVSWLALPRHDPLVAVGLPSETYALFHLGFAVIFVIALHQRTGPLLIREGDRMACDGMWAVARGAWVLGGVKPADLRARMAPCAGASR
jgi:hypothetical protein